MPIEIIAVESKNELKQFLDVPYRLYKGASNWVPPLRIERAEHVNPAKNPTLADLEVQRFLAKQDGKLVGRIAAIKNNLYLSTHKDETGHFGFFDAVPDQAVMEKLMGAARDWLAGHGLSRIVGPFSHTINEEVGILVDGFDTPPSMMMPFARPDYGPALEAMGFQKAMDMIAYWADIHAGYPRPKLVTGMLNYLEKDPDTFMRPMRKKDFLGDVQIAMDIFNDAWSENWGFIPFTDIQIEHMANELKPLILKDFFWVCEHKGEPAAFILMLPNLNEAIVDLNGKLLPFGVIRLLYRLKVKGLKTARIPLMGVKKGFQRSRIGLAMAASLSEKAFEMGRQHGYTHVEMSWILETNKSMIRIIEQAQGVPYKTYRMYEKKI